MGSPMLHQYITIQNDIPKATHVKIEICNILGPWVRTLVNESKTAGSYQVVWDGKDDAGVRMPSGIYFYVLRTSEFQKDRKMLLLN